MITIKIQTGGAAFMDESGAGRDDEYKYNEVARLLREAARQIKESDYSKLPYCAMDFNGNKVCTISETDGE